MAFRHKRLETLDLNVAGTAQTVQRLATVWAVWGSNAGGSEIIRTGPDQTWGPPSPLHERVPCLFPWSKAGRAHR